MQYHFFLNSDASKYYTEGVFSNPIRKFLDKATEIKNAKPNEFDGPIQIKKFIDKYYNDIITMSNMLEKEPHEIRKNEFIMYISCLVGFIGGYALLMSFSYTTPTILTYAGVTGGVQVILTMGKVGIALMILTSIASFVYALITWVRQINDRKVADELLKVRNALTKLNTQNLPKEYKIKISEMITAINDAETEINAKMIMSKESADDLYTEGFTKDVSKTYRDSFNLANNKIKEAKKFMKSGEYIEARVSIKQARQAVTTAQKQINEMSKNTNLPDNIIGMIYGNMISLIKALVFALPTLGFSFGVAATKNLYTEANAYYTKIKNKEDIDSSVFNTYLNHVNHVLNEVIRTLNKLEAEIAKKENSSPSSSDTTSKPNKKKIFNKKDKNINESTSVKVLLASDLLSDMEDLF